MILSGKRLARFVILYIVTPTRDYKHKPFSIRGNGYKTIRRIQNESCRSLYFPKAEEDGLHHLGITIDKTRDKDLSEQAYKLLKDYYCKSDEDSPQQAFARASRCIL